MPRCLVLALAGLLGAPEPVATGAAEVERELLRDPGFAGGFRVLALQPGAGELSRVQAPHTALEPVWQLAQWHSRLVLTRATSVGGETFEATNLAKWFCLERAPAEVSRLVLGVDSRPEYEGRLRKSPSDPWVHLLVQQEILDAPSLARLRALSLRFRARLRDAETFRMEGYTPSLHAAQFQVVLTLNNCRRDSPGHGDYLWFVVPVYDDRYASPPEYIARDFAVTRGKLIVNPGAAALGLAPVRVGGWLKVEVDLRSWLERALRMAWDRGELPDSRDAGDYAVAHLNLGWEVPGLNRVTMELCELSLRAVTVDE